MSVFFTLSRNCLSLGCERLALLGQLLRFAAIILHTLIAVCRFLTGDPLSLAVDYNVDQLGFRLVSVIFITVVRLGLNVACSLDFCLDRLLSFSLGAAHIVSRRLRFFSRSVLARRVRH